MSSFAVTFTGKSSILRADFFPEITLDPYADYCCALLDFCSYNTVPNIIEGENNVFSCEYKVKEKIKVKGKEQVDIVDKKLTVALPTGAYEVDDILQYLKTELSEGKVSLTYEASVQASKVKLVFDTDVVWTSGSLLNTIGFYKDNDDLRKFESKEKYWSDDIVRIRNIDVIRIDCDIVSGSYINGRHCHTIHQFSHDKVGVGHKYIEIPRPIVYLPIKEKNLRSIQISIVDQHGKPVDFRGEQITCRIHIKKTGELGAL